MDINYTIKSNQCLVTVTFAVSRLVHSLIGADSCRVDTSFILCAVIGETDPRAKRLERK